MVYRDYIDKVTDAGRTFILSNNVERLEACRRKFIFRADLLKGRIIYLVDDSLVRGNTLKAVLQKLREIEVRKIHLRITSPPVISQCYFGIDIPTRRELIADDKTVEEIRDKLGVESLKYLDKEKMKKIFGIPICTSCFDGEYNTKLLGW